MSLTVVYMLLWEVFDFYGSILHRNTCNKLPVEQPAGCVQELLDKETLSPYVKSDRGQYLLVLMTGVGSTHVSLHPNVAKD